jgi:UDP-glucose 4-epimerase
MISGKKIFITGGAGFIGASLISRLIKDNQVVVFDNFTRDSLTNKTFKNHSDLEVINGSILDYDFLVKSMKKSDVIVHCAGIAGVDSVIKSPITTMEVNMTGTSNVLKAASKLDKCDRVICFSTSEVFGSNAYCSNETDCTIMGAVGEARWTYAVSKLAGEHLAHAYFKEKGLPTTTLRPFNVYGPGQVGEGAIRTFVKRAIKDKPLYIHGEGTQIRAWCFIDDMIDAILLAITNEKALGESFNIGNQKAVMTIYGLANTIVRVLNSKSNIEFRNKDYVDVELRIPSVQKAKELLNFEAKMSLEEGLLVTADHYRQIQ